MQADEDLRNYYNILDKEVENLTISLQEKTEDLKQINNEVLPSLTQEDVNLHNRCNTLDKEVKNLINLTAPYEEKIKYLDEKIKYLEDKIKALTGE
jgi:chromosome segregation ATPase